MHSMYVLSIFLGVSLTTLTTALSPHTNSGRTRSYFIACVEREWDYAPNGDLIGVPDSSIWIEETDNLIGSIYYKALYREFTDSNFNYEKEHNPELGSLGPMIRAEVGDTIIVHFKNFCSFDASMHPHGVSYDKESEGAPYLDEDGTNGGDSVAPDHEWIYTWVARSRSVDKFYSSKLWLYHSHVAEDVDIYSGLIGPIIITAKGAAISPQTGDLRPKDVDREIVTFFVLFDENASHLYEENISKVKELVFDDEFEESNLMHSINGYLFGNLKLGMYNNERVRWYIGGFGNEMDGPHTPHWHGNVVEYNGEFIDLIEILPGSSKTVDMYVDNPGNWIYHCHVFDHIHAGMSTIYNVYE